MKKKRNSLERKLDEYNHTMELVRTIVPIVVLIIGLTYGSLKFTLIAMPVSYLLAIVISDYESEIYQLQTINLSETEVIKNKEEPYLVPDCYHKKVEEGS